MANRDLSGEVSDRAAAFLLLIIIIFIILDMGKGPVTPRLIGINCEGSGGDIWAMEKSDFPTDCQKIEEYE